MRRIGIALAGLFVLACPVGAQEDAGAILDRAIKAHGGEEQLARFKARRNKTKGTLHLGATVLEFTQDVYFQTPSQVKEVTEINDNKNQKIVIVSALNGDKGWIRMNDKERAVDDTILNELKESAHVAHIARLAGLRDGTFQLTLLPEAQVNGRAARGIKVAAKGFRDVQLYFDKETGLLTKTERQAFDLRARQLVKEESYYSDWKVISGIKMPTHVEELRDGKQYMEATATEIKLLERLDDSVFAKP